MKTNPHHKKIISLIAIPFLSLAGLVFLPAFPAQAAMTQDCYQFFGLTVCTGLDWNCDQMAQPGHFCSSENHTVYRYVSVYWCDEHVTGTCWQIN